MNSKQKAIIFIVVIQSLITLSQSQCPTQCLHDGVADAASCTCNCLPAWEGSYCERAKGNCATGQPTDCGVALPASLCIFSSILNYCPQMCSSPACTCGLDSCLNNGVFIPSSCSCKCPTNYYGTICENYSTCSTILTCQNFGTFNPNTCACSCISPNFSGSNCESLTCSIPDPIDCSSSPQASCVEGNIVYSRCPRKCGRCVLTTVATTTIATTTIATTTNAATTMSGTTVSGTTNGGTTVTGPTTVVTSCNPLSCQNGFTFNAATCACSCGTGFSGSLCENYNCATSPVPDNAGICPNVPCGDPQINGQCPFKCLCGGTTGAPTTTGVPTTSVVTSCNPLSCQNGFTFNAATCSCSCGTGFSGSLCEQYNCATQPVPDNAGICPNVPCGDPQINGQCPFKCLCNSSPNGSGTG